MILMIDGNSVLTAAYYATLPQELLAEKDPDKREALYSLIRKSPDGRYINGVAAAMKTIKSAVMHLNPEHVLIAFDASRSTTFRKRLYPSYKGKRGVTERPLKEQKETLMEGLKYIGFAIVSDPEYEADDLIASAVTLWRGESIRLYSRDQDYFQLVNDKDDIRLWMPMSEDKLKRLHDQFGKPSSPYIPYKVFEFTEASVEWWYGATSSQVPDLKGIMGDSSDNIPGIKGISSAASPLLKRYGSLEGLYKAIEEYDESQYTQASWEKELADSWKASGIKRNPIKALKSGKTDAFLCRYLAQMRRDCPLGVSYEDTRIQNTDGRKLAQWCKELGILDDIFPH